MEASHLTTLIQKCITSKSLKKTQQLHALLLTSATDLHSSPFLYNNLLSLYAKCGSLEDAHHVFAEMPHRNPVSYNALISAYSRSPCHCISALKLLSQMATENLRPNSTTFSSLLQASSYLEDSVKGAAVHAQVVKSGFLNDLCVQTSLLGMYSHCTDLESAKRVFGDVVDRDAVAWNSMIFGNMKNGNIKGGLHIFCGMIRSGSVPTQFTFSIVLNGCSRLRDEFTGKTIHAYMIKSGITADVPLHNALLDMYSSCGDTEIASSVFKIIEKPDLVSWNSMIMAYSGNGDGEKGMEMFIQLQRTTSVTPDDYTFAATVSATGALPAMNYGKPLHAIITKAGFEGSVFVGSTLINMYFKNEEAESARKLFNSVSEKDAILWTEMISGHSKLGDGEIAIEYFNGMQEECHKVDSFALSSVLSSAADLAALKQGEMIHCQVVKTGNDANMCVCGSLIDMYAKNGLLEAAHTVFSAVRAPDLKCWNSIMGGFSHHGHAEKAFQLFNEMLKEGLRPDQVTFVSLLSACNHCGLVDTGRFYWNYMIEGGLMPGIKHYSSMVSLLSRARLFREAEELINGSTFFVHDVPVLWRILLGSCVIYRELGKGIHAAGRVLDIKPEDGATHILLSNLYAEAGRWDAVAAMRRKIRGLRLEKDPGLSWIEITNKIHVFSAGDESHPRIDEVQAELQRLRGNLIGLEISVMSIHIFSTSCPSPPFIVEFWIFSNGNTNFDRRT